MRQKVKNQLTRTDLVVVSILIHSVRYSLNPTQAAEILTKHNFRKEGDEEEKGEQKKMMRPWKTRTESRK